jgi:uncharacterized protein YodC (DUF2158 family)
MANGFQVGDTVELKSGGPTMVIDRMEAIEQAQGAVCSWFDQKMAPQKRWFPLTSLKKADA